MVFSGPATQKTFRFSAAPGKQESFLFSGLCEKGNWLYIIFCTSLVLPPLLRDPVKTKEKTSLLWTAYNSASLLGYGKVCRYRKLVFRVLSEACPTEAGSVNHIWQPFVEGLSQPLLSPSVLALVHSAHTTPITNGPCTWWFYGAGQNWLNLILTTLATDSTFKNNSENLRDHLKQQQKINVLWSDDIIVATNYF